MMKKAKLFARQKDIIKSEIDLEKQIFMHT